MSKKVVHLSDDAHDLAKAYCKDSGMKMSDWVAMLIKRAVEPGQSAPAPQTAAPAAVAHAHVPPVAREQQVYSRPIETHASVSSIANGSRADDSLRAFVPKKKPIEREMSSENEDVVPVYAQPPFWARSKSS